MIRKLTNALFIIFLFNLVFINISCDNPTKDKAVESEPKDVDTPEITLPISQELTRTFEGDETSVQARSQQYEEVKTQTEIFQQGLNANMQREMSDVIGRWVVEVPGLPEYNQTIEIIQTDTEYVMKRYFKDGSLRSSKLIEYFAEGKRRFKESKGNTNDEYYVIASSGELRMYDREGYIKTAQIASTNTEIYDSSKKKNNGRSLNNNSTYDSIRGTDNGHKWNKTAYEAKMNLCKDLAKRIGRRDAKFYYEFLEEFYNDSDPNLLNMTIAELSGMASVM